MIKNLAGALFFSCLLQSHSALTCRYIPTEKDPNKYHQNLIENSPDIYWVEAVEYSSDQESFRFKVIETLRGEAKKEISLEGQPSDQITDSKLKELSRQDFNLHKKNIFWTNIADGRLHLDENCRMTAYFDVGEKYLILMKPPFKTKSFEIVRSKNDRWYKHIKQIYPTKK